MLMLLTILIILLLLCRVPVAFAFLLPSLIYMIISPGITVDIALQRVISGVDRFALLAVPLFILAGNILNVSGITDRIFHFVELTMSRIRGSLGYANIGASVIFSGMSGAAVADAAGLGSVEVKAMRKAGYDDDFSIGITAASSTIGPIIPPSIPAVVYGVTAGVSIGGLFVAGILPGILMALCLAVMVFFISRKRGYPKLGRSSAREMAKATIAAFPALLTPVIILGGIISGIFTPTEAAGATVIYSLMISFIIYRTLDFKRLYRILVDAAEMTVSILFILGSVALFAWILAREQAPQALANVILDITDNTIVFLLLVNILLLLVGMILEPSPAILILVPVLTPAVETLGIHPLHFGMIVILNLMIGLLTPPVGNILYVLNAVLGVSYMLVVRAVLPFIVVLIISLLLVTYIPSITLFLPRVFGFL